MHPEATTQTSSCTNYSVSSIALTLLEKAHLPVWPPRGCLERRVCHWLSKRRWRFVGRCLESVARRPAAVRARHCAAIRASGSVDAVRPSGPACRDRSPRCIHCIRGCRSRHGRDLGSACRPKNAEKSGPKLPRRARAMRAAEVFEPPKAVISWVASFGERSPALARLGPRARARRAPPDAHGHDLGAAAKRGAPSRRAEGTTG